MRAFEDAQRRQAGAASGIAGLGRQGQDMLTNQIGTLTGLGATGRGIQDRALGYGYDAALEMANEPYLRFQRGQQALAGLGGFLPSYTTGYGSGSQATTPFQDPSFLERLLGSIGSAAGGGIVDLLLGQFGG